MPKIHILKKLSPPMLESIWARLKYQTLCIFYQKRANYNDTEIAAEVAKKNTIYKSLSDNLRHDSEETAVFFSALWFLQKFYKKEKYQILDFGGGGGSHYFTYKERVYQDINDWIVVETSSMVEACKTLSDTKLRFSTLDELETKNLNVDLIYSSCALQYTASPEESLSQLLNFKAKALCFSRVVLATNESQVQILEISKLGGNGPIPSRGGFKGKKVSYISVAIPQSAFEKKIEESYTILLRIENGPTRAYLNAGVRNTKLMTYIAVLNPNQT
jgi:putative methyltransferase (TIGR04325 family)